MCINSGKQKKKKLIKKMNTCILNYLKVKRKIALICNF